MHRADATLGVGLHHERLVDASEIQVAIGLNIQNARDARLNKQLNIVRCLRIRPEPDIRVTDFVEVHTSDKVGISHLDSPVDYMNLVHVRPEAGHILPEESIILTWAEQVQLSGRLALPDCVLLRLVID